MNYSIKLRKYSGEREDYDSVGRFRYISGTHQNTERKFGWSRSDLLLNCALHKTWNKITLSKTKVRWNRLHIQFNLGI